ncbi:cobalt transporter [Limnoraphis robusta Tam1]|uniref:Cobalt transporter n=1 Tax=Limnoraphis robusta CCNP1315 TaxID=3110306 RepID=A0ABU5U7T5_9CYAN|nr:cobalt transporter [Limnoraphis robusta]MEA5523267.1 cobalt transporter [Limnoraphis robusta CCNP1315]MEA5537775.1 cobalt transporter [Limnoraphis robusta Tam1]MEA5549228.1 cobalt transporter [Limnoraphis robusta CCNP1324]
MKPVSMISSVLAVSLVIATPNLGFAHVGHGDEFQAEGGIERVPVNAETDSMLGIVVTPIEQATTDGNGVMVPATALVDSDGKQLVFVQYENFYEPVPVTTGATQGELIEVTEGLSVGENLVTQGSLSLYAESRKTQTVDVAASSAATSSPQTDITNAQADTTGNLVQSDAIAQQTGETAQESGGFPMGILAALAGGVALLVGGFVVMGNRKNKV